jgi:integrase
MSSIKKRANGQWRARYRDPAGKEHARHFARKVDAQRWLDETTTAIVSGQYVDPSAGRTTLRQYAETWRTAQVHRPSTQARFEMLLRRYVYPTLGGKPLSTILPSDVQAWVSRLATDLSPNTVANAHSLLSSVLRAAVRDRRIVGNPCEGTKLPRPETKRIVPLSTEQIAAITEAMPAELRALVTLAAGTGMRQGECLGLTVDRVDFLRRVLTVDRQMVTLVGQPPSLGPPKTSASVRTIPLPTVVVDALAAHLAVYPTDPGGLVFTIDGAPISRSRLWHVWSKVVRDAGLPAGTVFHALRHYYASLLIRHGESVKTVQARLGHASAGETLDTYSHLWPDSDDRTREAIDSVLGAPADNLRTGEQP